MRCILLILSLLATAASPQTISEIQTALKQNPHDPRAHYQLGLIFGEVGDMLHAEGEFRQAIEVKPDYAEAHYRLALTLIAQPKDKLDWPQAAGECRAALKIRPEYPEALNLLGVALVSMNRSDEAVPLFERAIRLWPDYGEAHLNLGMAREAASQTEAAIAEYRLAIDRDRIMPRLMSAWGNACWARTISTKRTPSSKRPFKSIPIFQTAIMRWLASSSPSTMNRPPKWNSSKWSS